MAADGYVAAGRIFSGKVKRPKLNQVFSVVFFETTSMTVAQKIWDFLFGVALIAASPILIFFVAVSVLRFAVNSPLVSLLVFAVSIVAFFGACIWRKRHRALPGSFFIAEVIIGIFASILFMAIFVAAGYAAYRAD